MEIALWILSALGFVLTIAEIVMGFPTLRGFWRWARLNVGGWLMRYADRRMPFKLCQVNIATGEKIWPHGECTLAQLRLRERLQRVREFASWLMRDPHPRLRPSYRLRQRLRALGLEDLEKVMERQRRPG